MFGLNFNGGMIFTSYLQKLRSFSRIVHIVTQSTALQSFGTSSVLRHTLFHIRVIELKTEQVALLKSLLSLIRPQSQAHAAPELLPPPECQGALSGFLSAQSGKHKEPLCVSGR